MIRTLLRAAIDGARKGIEEATPKLSSYRYWPTDPDLRSLRNEKIMRKCEETFRAMKEITNRMELWPTPGVHWGGSMTHLVPAIAVKDKLIEAFRAAVAEDPRRMLWYRPGNGATWLPSIDEYDWNRVQRAVVHDGEILGYVSASVDRELNTVTEIAVVRLCSGPSLPFLHAVRGFVYHLLAQFEYVRFSAMFGNPAAPRWKRFAQIAGGERIGVFPLDGKLEDGRVVDRIWFGIPGRGRTA